MLNSEVIFLEFVTGTSDFGGKLLNFFPKKTQKNATRFFLEIYGRSRRATQLHNGCTRKMQNEQEVIIVKFRSPNGML